MSWVNMKRGRFMSQSMEKERSMPKTENQNPSENTSQQESDFSKEIEIAESIKKQALDHYKRESIDEWNIQHSVIRNYLWLSLTFIAGYCAVFNQVFDRIPLDNYLSVVSLAIALILSLYSLYIGITSMTGTSSIEPDDNYVEMFEYLTSPSYYQGNHFALLTKEIQSIKKAIEEAQEQTHNRGIAMRRMNRLLKASMCFGVLSLIFYFLPKIF